MVEVNVRDQRNGHGRLDLGKRGRRLLIRDGDADQLAARALELSDLLDRRRDVPRIGRAHRLDRDGSIAADLYRADLNLPGLTT
jgi:hypothetical protein